MRSVYVKAEPQEPQVSGAIMGVEEAEREGLILQATQIFLPRKTEKETGLMAHQRGVQVSWFSALNTM